MAGALLGSVIAYASYVSFFFFFFFLAFRYAATLFPALVQTNLF